MTEHKHYEEYLVNILYNQALSMSRSALQNVLFYEEETTDNWTLKECQIQYVKDQIEFFEDGNLDEECKETWNLVFNIRKN